MSALAWLIIKRTSQRVPDKNFRLLAERPLFAWIVESLLAVQEVDRVVINTDARAELQACGLEESERVAIRDRPAELCGADVSANQLLAADMDALDADLWLMTHVTNPFLSAATMSRGLQMFARASEVGRCDSLFSVNRHQTRFWRADGSAVNHDPGHLVPTQALEPWFEENSCLYVFTRASFMATGARIGAQPLMFETPKAESVDIDDLEDWALAERFARG